MEDNDLIEESKESVSKDSQKNDKKKNFAIISLAITTGIFFLSTLFFGYEASFNRHSMGNDFGGPGFSRMQNPHYQNNFNPNTTTDGSGSANNTYQNTDTGQTTGK